MNAKESRATLFDYSQRRTFAHASHSWRVIRCCSPWMLLIPILAILSSYGRATITIWPHESVIWFHQTGTWILGMAFVAAVTIWVLRGEAFHRWMIFVIACLLCRSLYLVGFTSVAVALAVLVWQASLNFEHLRPYLENRVLTSLLLSAGICQILPASLPNPLWVILGKYGIWEQRTTAVLPLVGQATLLVAVCSSEVLWRWGRLTVKPVVLLPFERPSPGEATSEDSQRKAA